MKGEASGREGKGKPGCIFKIKVGVSGANVEDIPGHSTARFAIYSTLDIAPPGETSR